MFYTPNYEYPKLVCGYLQMDKISFIIFILLYLKINYRLTKKLGEFLVFRVSQLGIYINIPLSVAISMAICNTSSWWLGLGLERLLILFAMIDNIRDVACLPRTPGNA